MGFFSNILRNAAESAVSSTVSNAVDRAVDKAVDSAINGSANGVGKGKIESKTFTFASIPTSVAQLQALPEATLTDAFATTALSVLALCNFENNKDATFEMIDFLNGPEDVNPYTKQFITEHLGGQQYKVMSYFAGATVENNYTPTVPYTITVSSTPYSFDNENWATLYVQSAGADSPRPMKLRKKPSTGQWFLSEIQILADIRTPAASDPWA